METILERVLERLRTATNSRIRLPASTRVGVEQPQRLQASPVRAKHASD